MPNKNPLYVDNVRWNAAAALAPTVNGEMAYVSGTGFQFYTEGALYTMPTSASAGASKALDNLAAVAINTALISDTDSTDDLGSSSIYWKDTYSDRLLLNSTAVFSGALAGTAALTGALSVSLGSTLTGNVACGGDLSVSGTLSATGFASDAIVASTAATTLTLDGTTSGGVDICSTSTGGITLGDDTTVATGKTFTITNGAITQTAGSFTQTLGNHTLTDGNVVITEGKLTIDSTADDQNYIKRNVAATTGPLFELEDTNASADNETLLIDSNGTGAVGSVVIDHEGTADAITLTSLAASASLLKATAEAATGTVLESISAASATVAAITLTDTGTGATGWLGANGVGQLQITCDGDLAHANASCMLIEYSGGGAATGLGTSLRIVDTGSTASSTAVYISAATGEAMRVDSGTVIFDETLTVTGNILGGAGITSSAATGAGIGYATGAGGAVTQATNRSTTVVKNTLSGTIQTDTTSLAAGASAEFTFTNSTIAIGDVVVVSQQSGSDLIAGTSGVTHVSVVTTAAGSCIISVDNNSSTTAETGAIIINYAVIKAVAA